MKRKGIGMEDSPFMVLAAIAVMLMAVWMGITAMASFVEGNERQAAVDASLELYKRARLVSLGYDGSSDRVTVRIPLGYGVSIDGAVVAFGGVVNGSLENATQLTQPMVLQGVGIKGGESSLIGNGTYEALITYSTEDDRVIISW